MLTIYRGVIRFDRKEKNWPIIFQQMIFTQDQFFKEIEIVKTYFSPVSDCSASSVT